MNTLLTKFRYTPPGKFHEHSSLLFPLFLNPYHALRVVRLDHVIPFSEGNMMQTQQVTKPRSLAV